MKSSQAIPSLKARALSIIAVLKSEIVRPFRGK